MKNRIIDDFNYWIDKNNIIIIWCYLIKLENVIFEINVDDKMFKLISMNI